MDLPAQKILGISGSIRPDASSALLLKWIGNQFINVAFNTFSEVQLIPPFDGSENLPPPVQHLLSAIREADLVIICSPEYAHGVPGSLKNALDWTVASDAWIDKKTVVITASSQGEHAHASLMEILKTMSAVIEYEACLLIPFIKSKIDRLGEVTDPETISVLRKSIDVMQRSLPSA